MLEQIRQDGLLQPDHAVLVLWSGGRDSTCLLHLAAQLAGPDHVHALHVNYGLRGAASDADEQHCRALGEELGVRVTVHRPAENPANGNLQAWAREIRYAQAAALAGTAPVATGHTADDQAETILYRLASSPSRRALLGMEPVSTIPGASTPLIRPLLGFTREQTTAYCEANELPWREDDSNRSLAYARARVREGLLPALEAVHPAAMQNVLALADNLREEAAVLDVLVDQALQGSDQIELDRLKGLPPALARLVVQRLADAAAGRPAPGTARRLDDILSLPDPGQVHLPSGLTAHLNRGILRFAPTPPKRRHGARSARPLKIKE